MTLRSRIAATLLDGQTLARKILDRELGAVLAGARARTVLDVGGASGLRYRRLVDSTRYWTIDVQARNRPTIVGDAHALPVAANSVDLLLSLQVLEHCIHPERVLQESFRVLVPGGRLVLSTVLLYELHGSPHDYYRFTASALRDLARDFENVRLTTLGNRFVAAYDLTMSRSVLLNSVFGRVAFRAGTAPSDACPCGFILDASKPR
jgi:SAM-dependent methyltransferase